jgi:RHS repeat-associated protein
MIISYTFTYYDNGWLESVTDNTGRSIRYDLYDGVGQRDLVTLFPGTADERVLDYVYDAQRRLDSLKTELDATRSGLEIFDFGYDGWGRRGSLGYPNGVNATYGYNDGTDWLTSIGYPEIGITIGYPAHDKVGNRKQRTEVDLGDTNYSTDVVYSYDDTYQLAQATSGSSENYKYDPVGNRLGGPTVKEPYDPAVNVPADSVYQHDAANRMTHGRKFGYAYDHRGNQTHKYLTTDHSKRWEFVWNGENQLTEAKLIDDDITTDPILRTVSFKYDPFGRRIEKKVEQAGSIFTTSYTYDDEDIVLQVESDGTTATATQYIHGPGIDEPLAAISGSETSYYHEDGLGSIVAMTDASGNIVQRYSYEAFGQLTASDPTFDNFYTYTGREYDKETGLYYYRARYYDAMEGRFISKDTIAIGGNIYTQGVNVPFSQYISAVTSPYRYTENNPTNLVDPWGLWSLTIDIYFPYGGGLILGQNADGSAFLTLRAGVGYGGGVSFSPEGGSPGYDPCQTEQDFNASLGFFAEAAAQYGPGKIGASKRDGLHSINLKEAYPYRDNDFYDPAVAAPAAGGLRGSAAMGFEGGFVWKY